jgi:hypothetical protein
MRYCGLPLGPFRPAPVCGHHRHAYDWETAMRMVLRLTSCRASLTVALALTALLGVATPAGAQTDYKTVGGTFLWKVHTAFLKSDATPNSDVKMYANVLNHQSGSGSYTQGSDVAYLWTHENMIRALYWGAKVNPDRFQPLLISAIKQLEWYKNPDCDGSKPNDGYSGGYGVRHGNPCYYDDNSLLGGIMMNVYLNAYLNPDASNAALYALNYVQANINKHGGVPQKPNDPEADVKYYMSPMTRLGTAFGNWSARFPDKPMAADRLALAQQKFTQVNDPNLELYLADSGLFRGHTTWVGPNANDYVGEGGTLAGNTTGVIALALAIYHNTNNPAKLDYARALMNNVLATSKWFPLTGGIKQEAPTGAYAVVDLLCQLYIIDRNVKWYNKAKGIVDFIIGPGRDKFNWFANGAPNDGEGSDEGDPLGLDGTWAEDRDDPSRPADAKVRLLTQSAAAAAILQFAYIDQLKNGN